MDSLPRELVAHIILFLPTRDLKSFRLCSSSLAELGRSTLFEDFEFKLWPNSHRLYQLEQLSMSPEVASKLKCVAFESGIQLEYADYRYWQAQVCRDASSRWSQMQATKGGSRDAFTAFHAGLHKRFTPDMQQRYNLYRWHLDQEAALMAEKSVRNTMMRVLTALSSHAPCLTFKIIMQEPQITLQDVENFDADKYASDKTEDPDPRRRVMNRRQHCCDHFINFLDAAQLSQSSVVDLTAVNLPHQLLSVDRVYGADVLEQTFRDVRRLNLSMSTFPYSDWLSRGGLREVYWGGRHLAASRLRMLLNHPTNLESLRLEFPEGKEAEYSFDMFNRTNLDRFPRAWMPGLLRLEFYRFRTSWQDLEVLLKEGRSLKALTLAHCRLETGSLIDVVEFLPSMKLQEVSISGKWSVDEDGGQWHSHSKDDFDDCRAASTYSGPFKANGLRKKVESFMLTGEGDCPLPRREASAKIEHFWDSMGDTSFHYLETNQL